MDERTAGVDRPSDERIACPACGAPNQPAARFCDQCGHTLTQGPAGNASLTSATPAPPRAGDRRIVSALFADIVDYSRLVSELDAEEVVGRIDEAFGLLSDAVRRYDGVVEKFIGDAVFAVFGARRAHDDDPLRAALCALAMIDALEDAARGRGEPPLRLRVGVATGEVVASVRALRDGSDLTVTGDTVTTAMRLQELAQPGEILLDDATLRAARDRLEVEVIGERDVRGRVGPVRIHRLRGERLHRLVGAAGPGLLIGRVADRARLHGALEATRRTGRGRAVLLVGEAGIGKSRLVADVEEDARGLGYAWTWTENLSYTTGEYYAFARSFAQRVADEHNVDSGTFARQTLFREDLDEPTIRRFGGAIAAIARDARFSGWEAESALVPADPATIRIDLGDVTEHYLRELAAAHGPRAIIVDDLHWMDASSEPLLDRLVRVIADLPFVVYATTRNGPLPSWVELDHVEVLEIGGLDSAGTERLAAAIAGAELSEETTLRLHHRTAGNPLFVAETVRALVEDGALVLRDGRLFLRDPTGVGRIPVNLRALLGARIDALPAGARTILEIAAVIGNSFDPAMVGRLLDGSSPADRSPLDGSLAILAVAALVVPGEAGAEWRFRHPLIHDAAYAGTLASRRRELHARLADRLEESSPPAPIDQLAHHRAAAGDRARAVPLLELAAEAALAVGATTEAVRYWRVALRLLGPEPGAAAIRARVEALDPAPPRGPADAGSPPEPGASAG
jgi:adenylate cyclase